MNKENYLFGGVSAYRDLFTKLRTFIRHRPPQGKYLFHNSVSLTPTLALRLETLQCFFKYNTDYLYLPIVALKL